MNLKTNLTYTLVNQRKEKKAMRSVQQTTLSKQNLKSIRKAKEFIKLELDTNPCYSIYGTEEDLTKIIKGLNSILKKFD